MTWQVKAAFWTMTGLACLWLLFSIFFDVSAIHILREHSFVFGYSTIAGHDWAMPVMGCLILVQQPFALWLLIRAIWLRNTGNRFRIFIRAALSLAPALVTIISVFGLHYLQEQTVQRLRTGGIIYLCSQAPVAMDYDARTAGPIALKLKAFRHPDKPTSWIVEWPGKKPVQAQNFEARTGSIGGSQGIRWIETDGQHKAAYLSFSDIEGPFGTTTIWVEMQQDPATVSPYITESLPKMRFTCGPDPASLSRITPLPWARRLSRVPS